MSGLRDRNVIGGAVAASAVCCAAPIIGILGLAGFAATAVTLAFAGVVFAVVVGLAAIGAVLARRSRARHTGCAVPVTSAALVATGAEQRAGSPWHEAPMQWPRR
jgi:hypothetical protein